MSGRDEKLETAVRDNSLEKLNYRDWRNEAGEGYEAKGQFFSPQNERYLAMSYTEKNKKIKTKGKEG